MKWIYSIAFVIVLASCQSSHRDLENQVDTVEDFAESQFVIQNLFKDIHRFAVGDTTWMLEDCIDTIVVSGSTYPLTIEVDYGDGGNDCSPLKQGVLQVLLSSPYGTVGGGMKVTFENYMIDGKRISGELSYTLASIDSLTMSFVETFDMVHVWDSLPGFYGLNNYLTEGQYNLIIQTGNTADYADDSFSYSFAADGTDSRGAMYNVWSSENMTSDYSCSYALTGSFSVKPQNITRRDASITSCSEVFSVTINGSTVDADLAD